MSGLGHTPGTTRGRLIDTVTATFIVHPHSAPHLQGAQAVKEEFESWLESRKATVQSIAVEPAGEDERSKADHDCG